MQLNLSLSPSQRRGPFESCRLSVLIREVQDVLTGFGDDGGEDRVGGRAGSQADSTPEAEDGIQYRPDRVGERTSIEDRDRVSDRMAPTDESGTIRLVLNDTACLVLHRGDVSGPDRLFAAGSWTAGSQKSTDFGHELCFDEQVLEGRMSDICRLRRKGNFRIRRQLDLAISRPEIGQRNAADLCVVLGRHQHRQTGGNRSITARELGPILRVGDLVAIRFLAARLVAGRPHHAGLHVAQKEVRAPRVTGHILAPPGHGHVAPAAVAGSRGRDHHRIPPIGQHVRTGCRSVRRGETPKDRRDQIAHFGGALHLFGTRPGHKHVARHPLLEQQFGCLDDRVRMETFDHRAIVENVAQCNECHALVMGHVALHDRDRGSRWQPPRGVVERFAEAIPVSRSGVAESSEVLNGGFGPDHRGERGRVRSYDDVLAQAALQAEAGHAEARILVCERQVSFVECRF